MTEIPALRDALVEAAGRRARRRRFPGLPAGRLPAPSRRGRRAAAPALAACAVALAVAFVLTRPPAPDREIAATPADALAAHLAVFRRPRSAADAYPHPRSGGAVRYAWERSRRAGDGLWLVPATRAGRPELCTLLRRGGAEGASCGPVPDAATAAAGEVSVGGAPFAYMVVADGSRDARVTLRDGRALAPRVRSNTLLAALPARVASFGWTSAAGVRHVSRRHPLAPGAVASPQGCPALDPLPADADARARAAALAAVDTLYPGIERATVTAAARAAGTPCPHDVTARTIAVGLHLVTADPAARRSASLSQGRLLLGMAGGRMRVYAQQH